MGTPFFPLPPPFPSSRGSTSHNNNTQLCDFSKTTMAPTTRRASRARADWAANCVFALPELWAVVAEHSGLVGAWRLTGVCRASREGAKVWLRTLPGVVCGGRTTEGAMGEEGILTSNVWRLDLATLQWALMPPLLDECHEFACCVVRGSLVILGGNSDSVHDEFAPTARVQMLSPEGEEFVSLPPLSIGGISDTSAVSVEESASAQGQVFLLGGVARDGRGLSTIHLVDLATGECTPQSPPPIDNRLAATAAARLPDGRIIFYGYNGATIVRLVSLQQPPDQGDLEHVSTWKPLPLPSVHHYGGSGCVLSDGRFAILAGQTGGTHLETLSCEALTLAENDDGSHWDSFLPMLIGRSQFASEAVAGCIIVAGGESSEDELFKSVEVYDEALRRWRRLPCDLPSGLRDMGSALL
jgi:hypothetical protein